MAPLRASKFQWRRLLAGSGVALCLLAGTEIALRIGLGPPPAAIRVFAALGERDHFLTVDDSTVSLAYGWGERSAVPRTTDAPRVMVLGGSSVHGGTPGLMLPREFPGQAAAQLGIDVLNLGQPGFDSHDLVRIVDELSPVDVSALVVYTGHNDFGNTHFEGRYGTLSSALVARLHGVLSRLQLFAQVSRIVRPMTGSNRRSRSGMAPQPGEVRHLNDARRTLTLQGLSANLERIVYLAGKRGVAVVLVTPVSRLAVPEQVPCPPEIVCPSDDAETVAELAARDPAAAVDLLRSLRDTDPMGLQAPTAAQQLVRDIAGRYAHVALLDAEALLPRDEFLPMPNPALFIDPVHFSPDGHAEMGTLLAQTLSAMLDIPLRPEPLRSKRRRRDPPPH